MSACTSDQTGNGAGESKAGKTPSLSPEPQSDHLVSQWAGRPWSSPGQVSVTRLSPGKQPDRSLSFFPDQSSPREQPGT